MELEGEGDRREGGDGQQGLRVASPSLSPATTRTTTTRHAMRGCVLVEDEDAGLCRPLPHDYGLRPLSRRDRCSVTAELADWLLARGRHIIIFHHWHA